MKTAPFYYEAYAKGVNKGAALDKLCGILKISRDQVEIGHEMAGLALEGFEAIFRRPDVPAPDDVPVFVERSDKGVPVGAVEGEVNVYSVE